MDNGPKISTLHVVISGSISAASASASLISVLAIVLLLVHMFLQTRNWRRNPRQKSKFRINPEIILLLNSHFGRYAFCLLLSNFISSIAGTINFAWVTHDKIIDQSCKAQGTWLLMQIGDFSGAYFTSVIAVHVFNSLVLQKRRPAWICFTTVLIGWHVALLSAFGALLMYKDENGPVFAFLGFWCSISIRYPTAAFVLPVLPVLLAAFTVLLVYTITFVYIRIHPEHVSESSLENLPILQERRKWSGRMDSIDDYAMFIRSIFGTLLWYPTVFVTLVLPFLVVASMIFNNKAVSKVGLAIAACLHNFLGTSNAIIFWCIMRAIKPAVTAAVISDTDSFYAPDRKDVKSIHYKSETSTVVVLPRGKAFTEPVSHRVSVSDPVASKAAHFRNSTSPRSSSSRAISFPRSPGPLTYAASVGALVQSSTPSVLAPIGVQPGEVQQERRGKMYSGHKSNNIISCDKLNQQFSDMNRKTPTGSGLPAPPRPARPAQLRRSILDAFAQLSSLPSRGRRRADTPESPTSQHFDSRRQSTWSASDDGVAIAKVDGRIRIHRPEQATFQLLMTPNGSPDAKAETLTVSTGTDSDDLKPGERRNSTDSSTDEHLRRSIEERTADNFSVGPSRLSALESLVTSPVSVRVVPPEPAFDPNPRRRSSDTVLSLVDYPISARTQLTGYTFGLPSSPRHTRNASNATSFFTNASRSTTRRYRSRQASADQAVAMNMPSFGDVLSPLSHMPMSRARTQTSPRQHPSKGHASDSRPPRRSPSADDVFHNGLRPLYLPSMRQMVNKDAVTH